MAAKSRGRGQVYWKHSVEEAPPPDPATKLTNLEVELRRQSGGRYQPLEMRQRRRQRPEPPKSQGPPPGDPSDKGPTAAARRRFRETPGVVWREDGRPEAGGRVSVISPTLDSRQDFHEQLYACFEAQDWPDKELIIVETQKSQPSPFFNRQAVVDTRIVFVSWKLPEGEDFSIGLKRNIGLHLASGDWVASFDDDDLYAPSYLAEMLGEMVRQEAVAITLGAWFVFEECSGRFGYVDPRGMDGVSERTRITWSGAVKESRPKDRDEWLYGYGFSYVYSLSCAVERPYPDKDFGEDYDFFMRLKDRLPTALLFDAYGVCMHTLHSRSTSSCEAKEVRSEAINDLDVSALGSLLTEYLGRSSGNRGASRCFGKGMATNFQLMVTVSTSQGPLEVARPLGCAALDVRRLLAPQLGVQPADVVLFAGAERVEGEKPLADAAPVTLRMPELRAVLPIDLNGPEEVLVVCTDAMDEDVVVEVRVMSSIRMSDLRGALLQQHLPSASKDKLRRLKLAKRVGNAFVGVDEKLPLGDVRSVHVIGLADGLATGRARDY